MLWSHYADRHRGICLGFDIDPTLGIRGVVKWNYQPKKLKLESDDTRDPNLIPEDIQKLLFVTKFSHWSYEEELRVLVELTHCVKVGDLYFLRLSEALRLRQVILAPLCPRSVLMQARQLVAESGADALVSKARLGYKYFEVKEDGRYPPK